MKLKQKISFYFTSFWNRSDKVSNLSFLEKTLFIFLIFIEKIYIVCFKTVSFFKKKLGNKRVPFKVISVGNLSVGGTGKSVFIQFLAKNLKQSCAVITRGYGATFEKKSNSTIVENGEETFFTAKEVGDEPYMLAKNLKIPVVVGKNRFNSAKLLQLNFSFISTILLDDAYQNYSLKKDFEILLLDARKPFGNNHCLPAGILREKDISRADVIIFTHADKIKDINNLSKISDKPIFFGRHKTSKILLLGDKEIDSVKLKDNKFLVFAGIGKFNYFIESIKKLNLNVVKKIEYPDHHHFSQQDLRNILDVFKQSYCDCIITTSKDWVKILPLLKSIKDWQRLPIYVLEVEFEFLNNKEKIKFLNLIETIFIEGGGKK
ncbi:MAG: tetraacyldisaccharide 4'-kinase [bacterium]